MDGQSNEIIIKYFIGDALDHLWASVYNYRPQTPEILASKGEIFAVINLNAKEGFNSATAGNLLIDQLHETFFESKKESITEALMQAFNAVSERLSQLLAHEDEAANAGVDLNLAAVVIRGEEAYFASLGSHRILLLPSSDAPELIDVTQALRDPYGKGMIKIGSTFLRPDVRLLVATNSFLQELDSDAEKRVLAEFELDEFNDYDWAHPEEVAAIIVGYNLAAHVAVEDTAAVVPAVETELPAAVAAEINLEAEEEAGVESGADIETGRNLRSAAIDTLPVDSELADPSVGTAPEVGEATEMSPKDVPLQPPTPIQQAGNSLQRFSGEIKKRFSQFRKQREINNLQKKRTEAAQDTINQQNFTRQILKSDADSGADLPTWRRLLHIARARIISWKDYLLYDLLKVNQGKAFGIVTAGNGQKFLMLFGINISFRVLTVLGVIVGIFLIINFINGVGANQAREKAIFKAVEQLNIIKADLNELESEPVLNPKSTQDISAREAFLTELTRVEQKFTPEMEILEDEDLQAQKNRIESLRSKVTKTKAFEASVLLDVANVYQGVITDATIFGPNIYVLDGEKGSIYRQPLQGGSSELVVDGLVSPTSITVDSNGELIVYTQESTGVISLINPATKEITKINNLNSNNLPTAQDMAVYTRTNSLYTIAPGINEIKQVTRTGKTFSAPTTRARGDEYSDLRDVEIIDARVCALAGGTGLIRIGVDSQIDAFADVEEAVKNSDALGSDEDNIYIVDNNTSRLFAFTKSRNAQVISDYLAQVPLSSINTRVIEVTADKTRNLVLIVTESRVYSLNRTQLLS